MSGASGIRRETVGVGFYADRVFPRIVDVACNTASTRAIRERVCAPLAGDVLEIGFGTGLNLPHLPAAVTRLLAVDPMERGRDLARERLAASPVRVDFVGLDGQSIAVDDDSADAALSTWTLCTIPDPVAALREVARVLRPGATLHFAEHGASPDAGVRTWQDRLDPIQRRVACGCHLNRPIDSLLADAGLTIHELDTFYAPGEPKPFGWMFVGTAS